MRKALSLRYATIYPGDLIDGFKIAISSGSPTSEQFSINDLKLCNAFSPKDRSFLGSCWMLKHKNKFYVYYAATNEIFCANEGELLFEETDIIVIPLRVLDNKSHILCCKYIDNNDTCKVVARSIEEIEKPSNTPIKTLHKFEDDITFDRALCFYCSNRFE